MTLSITDILNNISNQMSSQGSKKSDSQNNEFVFEFQGMEYTYDSKAAFMEDIKDGTIDDGKISFIARLEKFAKDLPVVGKQFEKYDRTHEGETESEALQETEIAAASKDINGANQLNESAKQNINGIDESAKIADEDSTEDKELINEKNEEIAKLKEEIKQQEKEEKAAQEEKLAKAVDKAEKEYDPEKHGDSKEAYINKQVAGIIDSSKTESSSLRDELKTLETEVKDLQTKISNRNKINRQNNFSKFNMNVQSTLSTSATAEAEDYKKTISNLSVAA